MKRQAISKMLLAEISAQIQSNPDGMHAAVRVAFDKVLGAGRYDDLVDDLYRSLRAQMRIGLIA